MFNGNRWDKGRSETKYSYTYSDIALIKGCSVEHIRNEVSGGRLVPYNLHDVVRYLKDYIKDGDSG